MASKQTTNDLELILDYLRRENRPFSPTMLFENIKRVVSKPQVLKSLDLLTNDGKIICKEFGKAKVYMVNQDSLPSNSDEISVLVKDLEDKVSNVKKKLADLRVKNATLSKYSLEAEELVQIMNELSNIKLKIDQMIKANNIKMRTADSESSEKKALNEKDFDEKSLDEIGRIKLLHEKTHSEWYKRKRFCENLVVAISGITEIPRKQLVDEIGIEDDPLPNLTITTG